MSVFERKPGTDICDSCGIDRAEHERLRAAVKQNYSIKNLEIAKLREALEKIIEHHDIRVANIIARAALQFQGGEGMSYERCSELLKENAKLVEEVGRLQRCWHEGDVERHALRTENAKLREALEKIAEAPINWASLNPHDYARLLGKFQLDAEAALQPKGEKP